MSAHYRIASALLLSGCMLQPIAMAGPLDRPAATAVEDTIVSVPVADESGGTTPIQTRLCLPAGNRPAPLVVINHGSPPNAAARARTQLHRCDEEATRWFLRRGFAVAYPLRRGYGENGGPTPESVPECAKADYVRSGLETARDIGGVVVALTRLPMIKPDHAVIVGQSAGGLGTVAYDSVPHPQVIAMVSMAGGRGGHYHMQAGQNCHPERLVAAAGRFGATASTPMLWVFTANDSYFAPPIAEAMHRAFTQAGGRADLKQIGAFGSDGHALFFSRAGVAIWGPLIEPYLAQRGALPG